MRPIDGDRLMMHLTDWWYSSFGQAETDESKAIKSVLDKIEQSLGVFALEKQEAEGWIPVTERLPEEYGEYRITWKTSSDPGKRFIGDAEYEPGYEWDNDHDRFKGEWLLEDYIKIYPNVEVIAWKPLEEPYTEEKA